MGLPKQIQRQVEEVKRLEEAIAAEKQPQQPEQQAQDPAANEPQAVESVAEQPKQEVRVEAQPIEAKPQQPDSEVAKWEHKYKSLANHYTAFAKEQNAKIADLTRQLEELSKKVVEPQKAEPANKLVTDKDVEQFGDDLIDLQRRVAREVASHYEAKIAALEAKIAENDAALGSVTSQQQQSVAERFYAQLNAAVPQWEQWQETSECQEFLGSRVMGAKFTWNDVLQQAAQDADPARAAEVFKAFVQANPKFGAKPQVKSNQAELARQVAPSKSRPGNAVVGEKPVYSASDMDRMTQQIIKLSKAGKHDEAAALDAEMTAAYAEGRYKP